MLATHRPEPFDPLAVRAKRQIPKASAAVARMFGLAGVRDRGLDRSKVIHANAIRARPVGAAFHFPGESWRLRATPGCIGMGRGRPTQIESAALGRKRRSFDYQ